MTEEFKPDIVLPEPYASLIDAVTARDAEYFEKHPDATYYVRGYVPGEFYPAEPAPHQRSQIRVTQLRPGIRTRRVER